MIELPIRTWRIVRRRRFSMVTSCPEMSGIDAGEYLEDRDTELDQDHWRVPAL
ncbi:hypothetical protein MLPF_0056 [Mycobacterium lepromatosis]|nr:hypothetical protein MLPF_0056 [Mycobacterium lepromatosis]